MISLFIKLTAKCTASTVTNKLALLVLDKIQHYSANIRIKAIYGYFTMSLISVHAFSQFAE